MDIEFAIMFSNIFDAIKEQDNMRTVTILVVLTSTHKLN